MPTLITRLAAIAVFSLGVAAVPSIADAAWSCVPYARSVSDVKLSGDAWQWWENASGVYGKGQRPQMGSVIVFKRTQDMYHGHVAVVRQVVNSRKIIVDHANWGDGRRGKVDAGVGIIDVSPNNDWTQTRVWYSPISDYGGTTYPTFGFIYPGQAPHMANSPSLHAWNSSRDHEVDESDVAPTFSSRALMRRTQVGYSKTLLEAQRIQHARALQKYAVAQRPALFQQASLVKPAGDMAQKKSDRSEVFVVSPTAGKAPQPIHKPQGAMSRLGGAPGKSEPLMVPVKFVVDGKPVMGHVVRLSEEAPVQPEKATASKADAKGKAAQKVDKKEDKAEKASKKAEKTDKKAAGKQAEAKSRHEKRS